MKFIKPHLGLLVRGVFNHYVMLTFFGNRIVMNSSQISNLCIVAQPLKETIHRSTDTNDSFLSPWHFTIVCKGSSGRGTHICYIQGVVVGNFMTSGSFSLIRKHFPVNYCDPDLTVPKLVT